MDCISRSTATICHTQSNRARRPMHTAPRPTLAHSAYHFRYGTRILFPNAPDNECALNCRSARNAGSPLCWRLGLARLGSAITVKHDNVLLHMPKIVCHFIENWNGNVAIICMIVEWKESGGVSLRSLNVLSALGIYRLPNTYHFWFHPILHSTQRKMSAKSEQKATGICVSIFQLIH